MARADIADNLTSVWRHVDATVGQGVGTCGNLWNANVLSDGCFVEIRLIDVNVWLSVEPTNSRSQCGGQGFDPPLLHQQL